MEKHLKNAKLREAQLLNYLYGKETKSIQETATTISRLLHHEELLSWLFSPVSTIYPQHTRKLASRGITTIYELITTRPLRVEDYSNIKPINKLKENEYTATTGRVINIKKRKYTSITIHDGTGSLILNWFNITPFLSRKLSSIKLNDTIVCEGRISCFGNYKTMNHPSIKKPSEYKPRVTPIYPSIGKLRNSTFIKIIKSALEKAPQEPYEFLPLHLVLKHKLPLFHEFIHSIHTTGETKEITQRLKYEELFFLNLGLSLQRNSVKNHLAPHISSEPDKLITEIKQRTGFKLTNDQRKAIEDILKDMSLTKPMLRLLQGDVGSGKTIVALSCAYAVHRAGFQSAVMAPTQILASQWFEQMKKFFPDVPAAFLLSQTKNKSDIHRDLKNGNISILIGTHTLIEEGVEFSNLGFVVIDEQHRFGVEQRKTLSKKGKFPHTLIMSATPIPRTLSMVLYSKSELTLLKEMPEGRKPITTLAYNHENRNKAYGLALKEIELGHQVYILSPLIEKTEGNEDIKAAVDTYKTLKETYFKGHDMELLHGKLKSQEKERIFSLFREGKIKCLVSTTVIEVGVDSPRATVIIVENAERFGLSTLHQLRGRVGRGRLPSYAIFITGKNASDKAMERIKALLKTSDGFKIAELDYKLRGGGDILGTRQHGAPDMLYVDIFKDQELIKEVKKETSKLVEMKYPLNRCLMEALSAKWKRRFDYINVG